MRIAVFSTRRYDRQALERANERHGHELAYFEAQLGPRTATLATGVRAVCAFVNDDLSDPVVEELARQGVRLVLLRSAGFNHVDLDAMERHRLVVARVPAYSPHAVAEHATGLVLCLNRKLHRAYNRVREGNFSLDGLLGLDMAGRTVGVMGTGRIGTAFCRIMRGFGCRVLAHDPAPRDEVREMGVRYVEPPSLYAESDVLSLHLPLVPGTHHLVDADAIAAMKPGVMLVNTSRGALVDTKAVIDGLKSGRIGSLGIDVYEEEENLFFEDLSDQVIRDDVFARLLTFPNVLVTGHQGFFTREALDNIAETTLANASTFETGRGTLHTVDPERSRANRP